MDIFSQRKLLIRITILLAVLNISLIAFFSWKAFHFREGPPPQHDMIALLKKELQLSDTQAAAFKKIRDRFFEEEKILGETIRSKRDSINAIMYSRNSSDSLLAQYAASVAENEHKMELLRIEQAKQLRGVCSPEQLDKFETLVKEIRDYLKPDNNSKF